MIDTETADETTEPLIADTVRPVRMLRILRTYL